MRTPIPAFIHTCAEKAGHPFDAGKVPFLTDTELTNLKTEHTGCEIWESGCVWCLLIEEVRQWRAG